MGPFQLYFPWNWPLPWCSFHDRFSTIGQVSLSSVRISDLFWLFRCIVELYFYTSCDRSHDLIVYYLCSWQRARLQKVKGNSNTWFIVHVLIFVGRYVWTEVYNRVTTFACCKLYSLLLLQSFLMTSLSWCKLNNISDIKQQEHFE